ncbi:MAG TPA: DNA translocase FtsK 4TM domain-containing protein [Pseudomonadales bacterium]
MDKLTSPARDPATADIRAKLVRRAVEGLFLLTAALAAYFFIALASYHPQDPGWSSVSDVETVHNAAGHSGAWLADILFSLVGYSAYMIPLMLLYRTWLFFRLRDAFAGTDWLGVAVAMIGLLLVIFGLTGLSAINSLPEESILPFGNGGMLGEMLADSIYQSFGLLGGRLILFTLFFVGISFATDVSWMQLIEQVGRLALDGVPALAGRVRLQLARLRQKSRDSRAAKTRVEQRSRVFEAEKVRQQTRIPPKITLPDPVRAEPSQRVVKEKQKQLFEDGGQGLPEISLLLKAPVDDKTGYSAETLDKLSRLLEHKLRDFKIEATVTDVFPGPVVTRFEIQPAPGIKVSSISNLAKDIARSLAVVSVRVVEVIAGKTVIGIEIPNEDRKIVYFSELIGSRAYDESKSPLTLALGHDISGQPVVADLGKMPHLLVAGTTGSGKSVGVNAMLLSLLFKSTPKEVRLILVDPKMLELSVYDGIPHLLTPVITDMKDAANGLRWCVAEMERRYKLLAKLGVRNIAGFNKKVLDAQKAGEPIADPLWKPEEHFAAGYDVAPAPMLETLPYIVVVIDEFADMMMVVGKKVEELIARIAQKARAAGIHLILATQRPSVDVITGLIKANVPTRIAFQVSSKIDSRTILDQGGAEQLLGHGDMLYMPPGTSMLTRVHGAFVEDDEVHRVVAAWKQRGEPDYIEGLLEEGGSEVIPGIASDSDGSDDPEADPLYDEAVAFVCESRKASISAVQRKLRIGYNRAARMIEAMEAAGVVSAMSSNGQREVLAPSSSPH